MPPSVRRGLGAAAIGLFLAFIGGCERARDMPERVEMPDTMEVMRAMKNQEARETMMDTIPGGEMVRGDSTAARVLLEGKMPARRTDGVP